MPNRLANERSLYLRQHAHQPVDWWSWCPEAFAEAKRRDVPVLVSVGYASCHWCHVMAQECFDNPYIAGLMNQHFVNIKVDREERPDVDKFHMDAVQMIQQHGGWPLNCFCLADGRPFFGGTYFPPEDRGKGQTSWPQVLMRVSEFHRTNRAALEENANAVAGNLIHLTRAPDANGAAPDAESRLNAARSMCEDADDTYGGFGGAPKFPPAMPLGFLLSLRNRIDLPAADKKRIEHVVRRTLDAMDQGGLQDQIGGGFSRYCVDRDWTVPHFEKLICDNALLLGVYARAAVTLQEPRYAEVCVRIVEWLERDMRVGVNYAASLDADTEHHEGTTYVWTPSEINEILGVGADDFCTAFGITHEGNFEGGRSVPTFRTQRMRSEFVEARELVYAARSKRKQPGRDDKVLTGWNALLAANLARASDLLYRPDWRKLAESILEGLKPCIQKDANGLCYVYAVLGSTTPSTLSDYTWLAEAHLALATHGDPAHVAAAAEITQAAVARFGDPREIGYFLNQEGSNGLPIRQKDWWDNAVPAGNSSLLYNLASLQSLDASSQWGNLRNELAKAYGGMAQNAPHGMGRALEALELAESGITVLKVGPDQDFSAVERSIQSLDQIVYLQHCSEKGLHLCRQETCLPVIWQLDEVLRRLKD